MLKTLVLNLISKIIIIIIIIISTMWNSYFFLSKFISDLNSSLKAQFCSNDTCLWRTQTKERLNLNSSGSLAPPYDYNGFIAKLEFVEKSESSEATPTVVASQPLAFLTHLTNNGRYIFYLIFLSFCKAFTCDFIHMSIQNEV